MNKEIVLIPQITDLDFHVRSMKLTGRKLNRQELKTCKIIAEELKTQIQLTMTDVVVRFAEQRLKRKSTPVEETPAPLPDNTEI